MKPEDIKQIETLLKPLYELGKKVDDLKTEVAATAADHTARIKINEENIADIENQQHLQRNFCEEKREALGKRIHRCGSRSDNRWFDILKSLLLITATAMFSIMGTMKIIEHQKQPIITHPSDRRSETPKEKKEN